MFLQVLVAFFLCILFKVLNVNNSPERSLFYCANTKLLDQIIKNAPKLAEPYKPTRLWGYSGHIQTIFQGVISRFSCPLVDGKRYFIKLDDGALVTYDLYQPIAKNTSNDDVTIAIAPGICNSSESIYVRRVVYHAQCQGYRVSVLNHIGTLKCVPVTSARIFTAGNTGDYHAMIQELVKRFPATKIVCLGFSMGGNLVTKYLGETKPPQEIIAGISACQGYDAVKASEMLLDWEGFRRLYLYVMTENMRTLLRRWQKELFPEWLKREKGINERSVWAAATLIEMDEAYNRKRLGYKNLEDMYRSWSCKTYWENIEVPMAFVNALDDPIVPPKMLDPIRELSEKKQNFLFIEQKYGGHLGFYEGGIIYPSAQTWLDRIVVDLANGLTSYVFDDEAKIKAKSTSSEDEDDESCLLTGCSGKPDLNVTAIKKNQTTVSTTTTNTTTTTTNAPAAEEGRLEENSPSHHNAAIIPTDGVDVIPQDGVDVYDDGENDDDLVEFVIKSSSEYKALDMPTNSPCRRPSLICRKKIVVHSAKF